MHLDRWYDATPPEQRTPIQTLTNTFWAHIERTEGCWVWRLSRDRNGYGRIGKRLAHRIAWELANGPIPLGLQVCHHCDNPPCVRPDHLFLGTHHDNMADCSRKGRTGGKKLTLQQAREIKQQAGSMTRVAAAHLFGVSRATITDIMTGRTWRQA